MIAWLLSDLGQWIAGGIAAALGALALRWTLRRDAVRRDRAEGALAAAERMARAQEAGRKAEAQARAGMREGMTPDDVLRANDGRWNR